MSATHSTFPVIATGNASLIRPRFSPGLLLEDDDLTGAVDFTRAVNALLLRAMLGAGVLCGLQVRPEPQEGCIRITVKRGVAIDASGAVVEVPRDATLTVDIGCVGNDAVLEFWVVVAHTERSCGQRDIDCSSHEDESRSVATRLREGYKISIYNADFDVNWTRKPSQPDSGDCTEHCGDRPKPLLLAKIIYEQGKARAEHGQRSYIRPKLADDPVALADAGRAAAGTPSNTSPPATPAADAGAAAPR